MEIQQFCANLAANKVVINERQLRQFAVYFDLIREYSKLMNLTTIVDLPEVYGKHFYDSLSLMFNRTIIGELLDVGSGAGFPGVPLKIMNPDLELTLLEPTGKKTKFLTLVIKELNLGPVELVNKRAEDYAKEKREHFDIVTARAVADLPILCELCLPLVKVSGEFWAMKGPDITLELQKSQTAIKLLGGQLKEINQYTYDNQRRNNIGISKVKPSPAKYPRSYGLIRKQPL